MGFITVITSLSGEGGTSPKIIIIDNTDLLYCTYSLGGLSIKVLVEKLTSL